MRWTFRIIRTKDKYMIMLAEDHVTDDDHYIFYQDLKENFGTIPRSIVVEGFWPESHLAIRGPEGMLWWRTHVAPFVTPPKSTVSLFGDYELITPRGWKDDQARTETE